MFRLATLYLAAVLLLGVVAKVASGEEPPAAVPTATPATVPVDERLAGHTTMTITITADAIVAPAAAPAGPTLITQVNQTDEPAHLSILRIPDEVSDERLKATLESSVIPDWLATAQRIGNPDRVAPGGGGAVALIDLQPGRYLVMDSASPRQPAQLVVTGEVAPMPEIVADVHATMLEMDFVMPASIPAGSGIWNVANSGSTPHELAIIPVPEGATAEQVLLAIQPASEDTALPVELGKEWADWSPYPVAGIGATSPERRVIAQIDLSPGTYVAVCFVPDADLTPHLMLGMTRIFTVS